MLSVACQNPQKSPSVLCTNLFHFSSPWYFLFVHKSSSLEVVLLWIVTISMSFSVCCCLFNSCYCLELVSCLVFYDKYFEIYIYLSDVCQPVHFTISRLEKMENFLVCQNDVPSILYQSICNGLFFAKNKLQQILSTANILYILMLMKCRISKIYHCQINYTAQT